MWNVINTLTRKVNNNHEICSIISNGKKIEDEVRICNAFNEHFATAGKKVQYSVAMSDNGNPCASVKMLIPV